MGDKITEILKHIKKIAVVGFSHNPEKTSHKIANKLSSEGYDVSGVNPSGGEAFSKSVYKNIDDVPPDVDAFVFFRPGSEINQFLPALLKREHLKTVWLQLGIKNEDVKSAMETKGVDFIQDTCMAVELNTRGGLEAIRKTSP
jgi:uncharacterized protein